ncbi:uncharacterized protein RJT20DRAFT_120636 [Scheffersomyces xylosifermentans]|uniref:uncharacterized protein n=1 Tax=Scheffersomyces xylosifermentans TaxID=1304137 RepID=UPI00315DC584
MLILSSKDTESDELKSEDSDLEPMVRGRPSSCVFVASLCSSKSDDELCVSVTEHFQKWGKLSTVKVLRDTSNRPYAFVQYTNDYDSKRAIIKGHNSVLDGRNIRCEAAKVNRTLFVSSNESISEAVIRNHLAKFGEIELLCPSNSFGHLYRSNGYTRISRNWFCKFVYRDDAIRAFANITEAKTFNVEWTQNIEEEDEEKDYLRIRGKIDENVTFDKFSIFVGQLSSDVTQEDVESRFSRHGTIVTANLVKKGSNTFAFIKYEDESSAAGAVERENHSMFKGKTMHVQYRETHPAARRSIKPKHNGLALAPPPINFSKRIESGGSWGRKTQAVNHNTYPTSKKFNGYSSNNANRNPPSIQGKGVYGSHHTVDTRRSQNFREFSENNTKPERIDSPTPPPSDRSCEIYSSTRSKYSSSTAVNSQRADSLNIDTKVIKADIGTSGGPTNTANMPFFYYIPNTDINSNFPPPVPPSGSGPTPSPHSYYNLYQQYYVPYEGPEFPQHPQYGIPPYPMYYKSDGKFPNSENKG